MGRNLEVNYNDTPIHCYLAEPNAEHIKGGIILIHEVWGLTGHIKDVANRLSQEGYLVLVPDLLSEAGISESIIGNLQEEMFDPEKRNQAQPKLRELMAPIHADGFAEVTIQKLSSCFEYLFTNNEASKKSIAVMGFCFGGSYSFSLAVNEPRLKAAIPFYGHADYSAEELSKISCPVRAFYGADDERLISGLDELKEKMSEANVDFKAEVYPDCGHAFFNNTNRFAYNMPAAGQAWEVTLDFLDSVLD